MTQSRTADTSYPFAGFPGADLVEAGLEDLSSGRESLAALLVSIGAPRLRRAGFSVPTSLDQPERRLYQQLHAANPDTAHSQYNALLRRLVSFERAVEWASEPAAIEGAKRPKQSHP